MVTVSYVNCISIKLLKGGEKTSFYQGLAWDLNSKGPESSSLVPEVGSPRVQEAVVRLEKGVHL